MNRIFNLNYSRGETNNIVGFVDLAKVHGRVTREELELVLRMYNVGEKLLLIIVLVSEIVNGGECASFRNKCSVNLGKEVTYPMDLNVYMDGIIKEKMGIGK